MKLAAYLRVSTDRQAEEGLGLDVQEQAIRKWATVNGHRVASWHRDEGVSGSNGLDTRRGLLDVLNAIEARQAAGIIVYRLDRLARSLTVQEGTLAKVWGMGGRVFSVDLGEVPEDDPDDPMRTALRQMVGVFAQLERGMISSRMRAGRQLKAERGGYAYGAPPFGTAAVAGQLVEDTNEAKAVALIVRLRAEGRSFREIARELDAGTIPPRRAARWQNAVVRRIALRASSGEVHDRLGA
jgi:DNA invertase Pin-like site-specific DNA recombinase